MIHITAGPLMLVGACHLGGLLGTIPRPVWAAGLAVKGSKLLALFAGHALCDYPLQGQFLSDAKDHRRPIPGVPWAHALAAHSLIHAGVVALITGSVWLGLAEFLIHATTDYLKCDGRIGFHADQAIHYGCKVLWALL